MYSMVGLSMSPDVQAGVRMVCDSKRGREGSPPLAYGARTLIGVVGDKADGRSTVPSPGSLLTSGEGLPAAI